MKLRGGDKPIVTSTGFRDIRINLWGEKYGPNPKPVGLVLLIIIAIIAVGGLYPAYLWETDVADKTSSMQNDLDELEKNIERLMRPPEEESELAKLEAEIDVLRSAREAIEGDYGHFVGTIKAVNDTMPPTACWTSITLDSDTISLKGDADTPSGLFAIARAFEERSEFEAANIRNIGTTEQTGRAMSVEVKDAGSVEVTQMLLATGENILSPVGPGSFSSELISDPIESESGHEASTSGGATIEPYHQISTISAQIVSGNLWEPPVTIKFSGTASFYYPIDKYKWEFSDGAVKEVDLGDPGPKQLPISTMHTFTAEGDASANLTVIDDHGWKVSATKGGIFATADTDFIAELVSCDNPLKLRFKPQIISAEKITSYKWYFGEDEEEEEEEGEAVSNEPDSTDMMPIHTFDKVGEYTVTLTVSGQLDKPISISHIVTASGTPTADFYPERLTGEEKFTVRFADASVPDGDTDSKGNAHQIVQWEWDFGDGTTLSGSPNPVHAYVDNGPYAVTLKVWESDANCALITKTIQACDSKYSQFFVEPGNGEMKIDFSAPLSQSTGIDFLWDFGVIDKDGNPVTSTQANPSYKYDYSGTYHVSLRITEEKKSTDLEVKRLVSFISADINIISSTSTSFSLDVIPAVPAEENGKS